MDQPDVPAPPASHRLAMTALMANADRLLTDCDTLMGSASFASAASLATLAFEECGRAYALRYDLAPSDGSVDRRKYHHAVGMVALSLAILRKYDIDDGRLVAAVLPFAQAVTEADASTAALDTVKAALQATLEPVMKGQSSERNLELRSDVRRLIAIGRQVQGGQVGTLRGRGFQVETDPGFTILSDPATMARDVAERWAWAAEGVLQLLRRDDHRHPDGQEISVLMEALGQDRSERPPAA